MSKSKREEKSEWAKKHLPDGLSADETRDIEFAVPDPSEQRSSFSTAPILDALTRIDEYRKN